MPSCDKVHPFLSLEKGYEGKERSEWDEEGKERVVEKKGVKGRGCGQHPVSHIPLSPR